jgi:hypothetical protein
MRKLPEKRIDGKPWILLIFCQNVSAGLQASEAHPKKNLFIRGRVLIFALSENFST